MKPGQTPDTAFEPFMPNFPFNHKKKNQQQFFNVFVAQLSEILIWYGLLQISGKWHKGFKYQTFIYV